MLTQGVFLFIEKLKIFNESAHTRQTVFGNLNVQRKSMTAKKYNLFKAWVGFYLPSWSVGFSMQENKYYNTAKPLH